MYFNVALLLCSLNLAFAQQQQLPDLSKLNLNDLQSQLPAEFAQSNITIEDVKSIVKNKCVEAAQGNAELGEKHFVALETSSQDLMQCITNIVDYSALQDEIEDAKPRGELDAVFHKYCNKRPEALSCIENFNTKLVPCLDEDEVTHKDILMRIVTRLLNFICHKGGDQIALFIAEKGPECISSKKDDIQNCVNSTFSSYMPKGGFEVNTELPKFVLGQKQCAELHQMETCIVNHLEKCTDITPANLVESMFRFIRNETVCYNATSSKLTNGAGLLNINLICLVLSFMFLHSKKFISNLI